MKYKHNADWYGTVSHRHSKEKFLDALIGGGISLLGGLFGKSDAEKRDAAAKKAAKVPVVTDTSHTVDLKGLVASAEASGFNPMTILNAGGLSAFTSSHTVTTGQNAMAAVPTAPSFGSVVAQAAGNAFSIYRDDKAAAAAASTAALSSFPPAPVSSRGIMSVIGSSPGGYVAGGGRVASKTGVLGTAAKAPAPATGGQTQWVRDPAKPGVVLNLPFLGDVTLSKRSPAQLVEDELGDLAGSAYGFGRIAESIDVNKFVGRPPTMQDVVDLGGRPKPPVAGVPWITVQGVIEAAKAVYSQYGTNRGAAVAGQTMGGMYQPPLRSGGW